LVLADLFELADLFDSRTLGARLLVYSDGVFEIERPDGSMWQHAEFVDYLTPLAGQDDLTERLYGHVRQLGGTESLADAFSFLDVRWG
jgi:sigma-B regulation protein RsbU (phosphoserine phosphatase)